MRAVMLIVAALVASPPPSVAISARSRSVQPGEIVLLSIAAPPASAPVHVRAFDHDVAAYRDGEHGWQALVGIDLDVKPGTYPVDVEAGGAHGRYDLVVTPRVFRTRRLTVDEALVTPPAAEQPRIDRESALMAAGWAAPPPLRPWTQPFVPPGPPQGNNPLR